MNRRPVAIVLYEDSQRKNEFVPHRFVRACVQDRTGLRPDVIDQALKAHPTNGIDALIKSVGVGANIARRGEHLVALVDADRVRDHLRGLKGGATLAEVESELCKKAPRSVKFTPFVLERNLEAVLRAVAECFAAHEDVRRAAEKSLDKLIVERDLALRRASTREFCSERNCVMEKVSSFARFIDGLSKLCREAFSDSAGR